MMNKSKIKTIEREKNQKQRNEKKMMVDKKKEVRRNAMTKVRK